jgi:hypothetical protein
MNPLCIEQLLTKSVRVFTKSGSALFNFKTFLIAKKHSQTDKGFSGKETGQLFENLELSRQVEVTNYLSNSLLEDLKLFTSINI